MNVGLIGCGKRALWYGAICGNIDPNVYAALDPPGYHHMTYYQHVELQVVRATGFRLAKVYDLDRKAASTFSAALQTRPEVCTRLEDVSKGVDLVFIANDAGDGANHLELASPGLNAGVPTFVDRPLAATVKDAKAMVSLAERKRALLLSCSHMRMLAHAGRFKARFAEIGAVETGAVRGHGPNPAHIADGIELALFLFGDEFDGRVECVQGMGRWPLEIMLLRFSKPKTERVLQVLVVNSQSNVPRCSFSAKAVSLGNPLDSPDFNAFVQTEGGLAVMNALKNMLETRKPPLPYSDMIESVAVAEAGRRAHNAASSVLLKELR